MEKTTLMKIGIVGVLILAILFTLFVVRPAITGYSIYSQIKSSDLSVEDYTKNLAQLKSDLGIAQTKATTCNEISDKLVKEIVAEGDNNAKCREELTKLSVSFDSERLACESSKKQIQADCMQSAKDNELLQNQQLDAFRKQIDSKDSEYSELQAKYDLLLKSSATNICCKSRVDNPSIKSYDVTGGKIVCLEDGANQLSC